MANCVGIDFCSKKNCLEQERCMYDVNRVVEVKRGPKKKKKRKSFQDAPKTELCKMDYKVCANERACEILGQCILAHPLVKKDKMASKQLRKHNKISTIIKIISRLMPSLKRIGQRRYYKSEKRI